MSQCAPVSRSHALAGTESAETEMSVQWGQQRKTKAQGCCVTCWGRGPEPRATLSLVGAPAELLAGDWLLQGLKLFQPLRGGLVGGANLGLPSLVMKT